MILIIETINENKNKNKNCILFVIYQLYRMIQNHDDFKRLLKNCYV